MPWVHVCVLSPLSHVQLFATLWTTARRSPSSMGFSRQEYWASISFSVLCPTFPKLNELCVANLLFLLPFQPLENDLVLLSLNFISGVKRALDLQKTMMTKKEMATHSSILAWRIPWTEEPGRPKSIGLQSWTWQKQFSTWLLKIQNISIVLLHHQ